MFSSEAVRTEKLFFAKKSKQHLKTHKYTHTQLTFHLSDVQQGTKREKESLPFVLCLPVSLPYTLVQVLIQLCIWAW